MSSMPQNESTAPNVKAMLLAKNILECELCNHYNSSNGKWVRRNFEEWLNMAIKEALNEGAFTPPEGEDASVKDSAALFFEKRDINYAGQLHNLREVLSDIKNGKPLSQTQRETIKNSLFILDSLIVHDMQDADIYMEQKEAPKTSDGNLSYDQAYHIQSAIDENLVIQVRPYFLRLGQALHIPLLRPLEID